jgi:hypothetical protein
MFRNRMCLLLCCVALLSLASLPLFGQGKKSIAEKIEWTWEVTPEHVQPGLPNVLLLGDSITRNYYPTVAKELEGKVNVYLFSASTSVGDPRLQDQLKEFFKMVNVKFRVVHFNNGMHGWGYTETEFGENFSAYIKAIRRDAPGAKLVWANVTPVPKDDPSAQTNARIDARNAITEPIIKAEKIALDDQWALMKKHPEMYQDNVHPSEEASKLQGKQAAETIEKLL